MEFRADNSRLSHAYLNIIGNYDCFSSYNGDADTACNFLGDEWFVEALSQEYNMQIPSVRHPWYYHQQDKYLYQLAGYRKSFGLVNLTIDLVTVKASKL